MRRIRLGLPILMACVTLVWLGFRLSTTDIDLTRRPSIHAILEAPAPPPPLRPTSGPLPTHAPVAVREEVEPSDPATPPLPELSIPNVAGIVLGPEGQPCGGAWLTIDAGTRVTRTTPDGTFRLQRDSIFEGFELIGFTAGLEAVGTFDLVEHVDGQPVTLRLHRNGAVEGYVRDEAGSPVRGAWVSARTIPRFLLRAFAVLRNDPAARDLELPGFLDDGRCHVATGADGRYRIPVVMAGAVRIDVEAPAYLAPDPVAVEHLQPPAVVRADVTLRRGASISGYAGLCPHGGGQGFDVMIWVRDGKRTVTCHRNASDHSFCLAGLLGGTYWIQAMWQCHPYAFGEALVEVPRGGHVGGVRLVPLLPITVAGTVRTDTGRVLGHVPVELHALRGGRWYDVDDEPSDNDGRFTLSAMGPGMYKVVVPAGRTPAERTCEALGAGETVHVDVIVPVPPR